jgi:hypothetical protein
MLRGDRKKTQSKEADAPKPGSKFSTPIGPVNCGIILKLNSFSANIGDPKETAKIMATKKYLFIIPYYLFAVAWSIPRCAAAFSG